MAEDNHQPGGIHAKKIRAINIVDGVQFLGGDPEQATKLVSLAQAISRGEISADEISTRNLVSGLQYISNPEHASVEDLRNELAILRTKVDTAVAAQEIPSTIDVREAKESLATVESELAKPQPDGEWVVHKLDIVNKIMTKSAEIAQSAGKIGAFVIQLAPIAATVWLAAQKLFGV